MEWYLTPQKWLEMVFRWVIMSRKAKQINEERANGSRGRKIQRKSLLAGADSSSKEKGEKV